MRTQTVKLGADYVRSDQGLWVPPKEKRPKCMDFFCGGGGFSLGMLAAGFEVVAAVDNWADAAITYMANLGRYPINLQFAEPADKERLDKAVDAQWKRTEKAAKQAGKIPVFPTAGSSGYWQKANVPPVGTFWFGDVRKMTGKAILDSVGMQKGELDCMVGGPPCQGFSTAGKRDVMDPRNSLVFEYARLIIEIAPKTLMMENVPGILNMITPEGLPVIDAFCLMLEEGGYGLANALKQSLTQNPHARVAMSGKSHRATRTSQASPKESAKKPIPAISVEQTTLF